MKNVHDAYRGKRLKIHFIVCYVFSRSIIIFFHRMRLSLLFFSARRGFKNRVRKVHRIWPYQPRKSSLELVETSADGELMQSNGRGKRTAKCSLVTNMFCILTQSQKSSVNRWPLVASNTKELITWGKQFKQDIASKKVRKLPSCCSHT